MSTTRQLELTWNPETATEDREIGQRKAADRNRETLELARQVAFELAQQNGEVNADDVVWQLVKHHGMDVHCLGNAAGSLFSKKSVWEWTGKFHRSKRTHARGNMLRIWRLKRKTQNQHERQS